jgi:hypothetical protein
MGERRPDANFGRRGESGPDGLPARPQNVCDGSGDGHALVERLRLARHRRAWPSRRHRDVRRRHAPRQRASTDVLARQQHRTQRRLRPCREPHPRGKRWKTYIMLTLHRVSTRRGTHHCNGLNGDTNRVPGRRAPHREPIC